MIKELPQRLQESVMRHASSQEIEEHYDDNVEVDDGSSSKGKKSHRSTNTK